jgi:two-component system chemotaxis sensor kinase CheA
MDMSKYQELFLSESKEHLRRMSQLTIALEQNPSSRERIDELFREAHSIKGMAASMGFENTAALAHHLEDFLDNFRQTGTVPESAVDQLLAGIDLLESLLTNIEAEEPEQDVTGFVAAGEALLKTQSADSSLEDDQSSPVGDEPVEAEETGRTLQVLIDLAADALAPAARALLALEAMRPLGKIESCKPTEEEMKQGFSVKQLSVWLVSDLKEDEIIDKVSAMPDIARVSFGTDRRREGRSSQKDTDVRTVRVRTALLDKFVNLTGELITNRYMLQSAAGAKEWSDVEGGLSLLSRLVTDLHYHVLQVRMTPLDSITANLPRLVRDQCRKSNKKVKLEIVGHEVELDRAILEDLADPLVHLVRNAIDHGIEEEGTVQVRAWREKDLALIEISDDGRGIDPASVRKKLSEKRLLKPAQIKALTERELFQWICYPGFSTASEITETSGRGVGMDVVKAAVESLGGMLEIYSKRGEGTRFLMKLPLSIAIIKILLVECDGKTFGVPITRVLRTLDIDVTDVQLSGRQKIFPIDDEVIPLYSLSGLLRLPENDSTTVHLVITEIQGRKVGLMVDRLSGQLEAFVKTLALPLNQLAGISGATITGEGKIIFILDPQVLFEAESEQFSLAEAEEIA